MNEQAAAVETNPRKKGTLRRALSRSLGNFGWPILWRELRADFRRQRFVLAHSLCLCALGAVVLVLVATEAEKPDVTPAQIGQGLFSTFFSMQLLVIWFVFPAFSATSFTDERTRHTLDLLLTTTLKPRELVWGKFLSATFYCLMYVLASIPLMGVAFLFGGVTPAEAFFAYVLLLAATLLVSMLGVCVSACVRNNVRAVISVYISMMSVAAIFGFFYFSTTNVDERPAIVRFLLDVSQFGEVGFRTVAFVGLALLIAVFAYLFVITENRVKPSSDNKASALRVLTLLTVPTLIGGWAWLEWVVSAGTLRNPQSVILLTAPLLLLVAWIFPTEDADVSRRNQRTFMRLARWQYPLRLFAPGAFWGFVYSVLVLFLTCGGLFALWRIVDPDTSDVDAHAVVQSLLTLPIVLSAFAAAGFFLSVCDFSPLYARLTMIFVLVITLLLPVIFSLSEQPDAIWTLYYVSAFTLWSSLHPQDYNDSPVQFELFGFPIIAIAQVLFSVVAVALLIAGLLRAQRVPYPTVRFSIAPPAEDASARDIGASG